MQAACVCERAPMTRALEKSRAWPGTVRRMGCSRLKQSTGAATLVIHMLAKEATNMLARMTHLRTRPGAHVLHSPGMVRMHGVVTRLERLPDRRQCAQVAVLRQAGLGRAGGLLRWVPRTWGGC